MKKIFTLLCALTLMLGTNVAQTAPKAFSAKKAQVAVEQMQEVQLEKPQLQQAQAEVALKSEGLLKPMQALNFNQLSAAPALKVSNQKAQAPAILGKKVVKADHNATPAVSAAPAKAPKAVMADSTVTAIDWQYDDYYYDVYLQSENDLYLFELLESTGGLTYGTTYTYADMYADWVCTLDGDGYPLVKATDATLTVTKDEAGLIHVAATMVLEGVKHVISYDEKPFEPSGVQIPLNGTELTGKYNSWYYMYLYTAKVGDNEIQLAFDATAEQATYTKDQLITDYCVYYSDDYSTYVEFVKAASDFTVTTTETTKTLAGSLYADNGDEYILNLVWEKPDAKEITLVADTLNFFTKMLNAGYYQMQGYTVDSTYAFSFYFISKSLSGNYTEEDMDAYSTWVDQKDGKKTVVSYQNLSAANIKASLVNDTLYYTGTMTLATNDGQEANITLNLSCPYTQEWGEWADFAPFDKNTGKFTYATLGAYTQVGIQVLERKDNTGLKQYTLKNWGKGYYDGVGQDLVLNMNPDHTFTFVSKAVNVGAEVYLADVATAYNNPAYASFNSYDPETGVFSFYTAVVFASNRSVYTAAEESLVMDRPITERDTVDIVSTALKYNDLIASNKVTIYYAADVPDYYLFRVTSNNATSVDGTFKWSDGTINDPNSYFSVSGTDKNYFQDGEFTVVTNDKDIALTGWMIGTDEKYYRLDMSYTVPTKRDTVDVISNTMTYNDFIASNRAVQFYAGEDAEALGFETFLVTSKNASSVEGTFDIYVGYSFARTNEEDEIDFEQGQFTVASEEKGIRLTGWVIGDDEKYYRLNWYKQTVFDERDTVKVNSKTLSTFYQESIQGYVYQSSNDDYDLIQFVTNSSEKLGTFKFSDLQAGYTIFRTNDGDYINFQDGEITVSEDEEGLKLTGLLIGKDEKAYVINIIQPAGILESDTDAPFNDAFDYTDMSASIKEGTITITAVKSGLSQMTLVLYADPAATEIPEGTYTISDSKEAGTALQSTGYGATGATPCYAATLVKIDETTYLDDMWFMVEGSITLSYDEYGKLKVEVDAKNSYGQPVTALVKYEKIEPKGTVTIEANTLQIYDDYAESYGIYKYYAKNETYGITLYAYSKTPEGTFDETNIDFGDCVISDAEDNKFGVFEGEFTVTVNGKNSTLTGSVLGKDTILYELNLKGFQGAIPGDAQEDFTASFSTEDMQTVPGKSATMITVTNGDGEKATLVFMASELIARTYEISSSRSINTVIASDSETLQGTSYTTKTTEDGDQVWHMVSGTVTINDEGEITVQAVNSYDKAINFTITNPVPDFYLQNYSNELYLGWNGSSTDENKIAMMEEADRMAVALTLTDAEKKQFTVSVTATDEKPMYLSLGTGFSFKTYADSGEQGHGYLYEIEDINKSQLVANKVSDPKEGNFYLIVYGFRDSYSALGGKVTDTSGSGKMRILGYTLNSADDQLTVAFSDIQDYIYRYVTATTPAPEPRPTEEPVVEGNILDEESFNFNGGTVGQWKSAGTKDADLSVVAPGYNNSAYAMKVTTAEGGQVYDTQVKYVGQYINGHTYSYSFKAKASAAVNMQVALQQDGFPFQGNYSETIALTTEWAEYSGKLTVTNDNYVRFLLNVGETAADYFFDQIVLIDETASSVMPLMMNNDDAIYTVSGQRVIEPVKGEIYIINGQQTLFE